MGISNNTIECYRIENLEGTLLEVGEVSRADGKHLELNNITAEDVWDLCNWWHWMDQDTEDFPPEKVEKDGLVYKRTGADTGTMDSYLVLVCGDTSMVSLPVGWKTFVLDNPTGDTRTDKNSLVKKATEYRIKYRTKTGL